MKIDKNCTYVLGWNPGDLAQTYLYQASAQEGSGMYCEFMCRMLASHAFGISPGEVCTVALGPVKQRKDLDAYISAAADADRIIAVVLDDNGAYLRLWVSSPCPDIENMMYMQYLRSTEKWEYLSHWQKARKLDELLAQEGELVERIEDGERRGIRPMRALMLEQFGGPAAGANDKKYFYQHCHDIEALRNTLGRARAEILEVRAAFDEKQEG